MSYIYDIILNFNKDLIEYFEWEEKDKIKYIKKVLIFKTDSKTLKDIINYKVKLDKNFTTNIPKYEINNKEEGKICLLTDGGITIGLLIKKGIVEEISRLLLDEELESLEIASNLIVTKIEYEKLKNREANTIILTRKEKEIKLKLNNELEKLYKERNKEKIIYLYYEYTNKENSDIEYIYNYLKTSLNNFNNKHIDLYKILSMSNLKIE